MARTLVRRISTLVFVGVSVLAVTPSAGAATNAAIAPVVSSRNDAKLGPILVARTTVYTLRPGKTACTTTCRHDWPPLLLPRGVKAATAGSGVDAAKLGAVKAGTGRLQITYAGKRLYSSAKDKKAGQVHGNVNTKWGRWSTVAATPASSDAASTTVAPTTAPSTDGPTQAPANGAPAPSPSANVAPGTSPSETAPPATSPPATSPPAPQPTSPPATQPPATTSPGNGGIGF